MVFSFMKRTFYFLVCLLMAGSFWSSAAFSKNNCQIVFDAGSSGTRLYVYEKKNNSWIEHEGPKGSALADPVREIRGAKWSERGQLINEL